MSDGNDKLQAFRISSLPPDFYYIPNFITIAEEASLLQKVRGNTSFQQCQGLRTTELFLYHLHVD